MGMDTEMHQFKNTKGGEGADWSSTWGCFQDVSGCCMLMWPCGCAQCAVCAMGELLDKVPITEMDHDGRVLNTYEEDAKEFTSCCSQCMNWLTFFNWGIIPVGCLVGICVCPKKNVCCYQSHILTMATVKLNKKDYPGPCHNSGCECCGAECYTQMCCPCTGPCTMCLIYRELKMLGAPPTEATPLAGSHEEEDAPKSKKKKKGSKDKSIYGGVEDQ